MGIDMRHEEVRGTAVFILNKRKGGQSTMLRTTRGTFWGMTG